MGGIDFCVQLHPGTSFQFSLQLLHRTLPPSGFHLLVKFTGLPHSAQKWLLGNNARRLTAHPLCIR